MSDLHQCTALELGLAIAVGELTPVEATEHYLRRIEHDDVGAFVHVDADLALDLARKLGPRPAAAGPLWGVPVAVKDMEATAGQPTSFGSAAFTGYVPHADSAAVRRLRQAGMPILGKTATPEFGLVCYTEPEGHPPARTRWNPDFSASGSSGGSAAAVAAGLAPIAQGADGGGSVRTPASTCGLVGVKPGRGRISGGTGAADAIGLSTLGALARDVRDAAALLDVLSTSDPADTDHRPLSQSWLDLTDVRLPRLRVGRYDATADGTRVHPDCVDAVNRAAELLAAMGHDVEETANPFAPDFDDAFLTVWCVAAATLRLPPGTEDTLRPITRHFRERGHAMDASAAFTALATVRELARRAVGATASYDVLLTPTLAEPPALVGALRNDDDPEFELQAIARFTPFTPPFNASGQPAVNVPMTVNAAGLPIGVQVVARPGRDDVAMALARDLQEASGMRETQASTW